MQKSFHKCWIIPASCCRINPSIPSCKSKWPWKLLFLILSKVARKERFPMWGAVVPKSPMSERFKDVTLRCWSVVLLFPQRTKMNDHAFHFHRSPAMKRGGGQRVNAFSDYETYLYDSVYFLSSFQGGS